jgi:NADPH-dependent curcumin reductase CurA
VPPAGRPSPDCFAIEHDELTEPSAGEVLVRVAAPEGVDVYFDSVGGTIAESVFPLYDDFARIVVCG